MLIRLREPGSTRLRPQSPEPTWDGPSPAGSGGCAVFFLQIGRIGGWGNPMLGPLPRHPQPTQGQSNGFVADQPRRETLGETDLGGERERPPARGLAKRPRTLMQQRPQGLAGSSIEDGRRGVRARREGLEHRETTMMEGMNDVTYGLIGAAEAASNRGRRLALGNW